MKSSTPTILYILYFCKLGLIMPQSVTFSNDIQTTSSSEETTEKLKSKTSMMSVSQDNSTMNNGQFTLSGTNKMEEGTTKEIKPTISRMTFVQDNATSNNAQSTASRTTTRGDGTSEEPKPTTSRLVTSQGNTVLNNIQTAHVSTSSSEETTDELQSSTSSVKTQTATVFSPEMSTDALTVINDVHSTTLTSVAETTTDTFTSDANNYNLKFVDENLSWFNATQYCQNIGRILASNESEVQRWLINNNKYDQVWLGKYEELTEWAYIKGCFDIQIDPSSKPTNLGSGGRLLCQKLCKDQKYFAVKNNSCICLHDVTTHSKCRCNDPSCVTIWEHNIDFNPRNYTRKNLCIIVTSCTGDNIKRELDNCTLHYLAICDNGHPSDNGHLEYRNYTGAQALCNASGSFVKWYTKNNCPGSTAQHRTSGRREHDVVYLHKYDEVSKQRLLNCRAINQSAVETHGKQICIEDKRAFLCREENGYDVVEPATIHIPENASAGVGAAIGSIVAGMIVIAVIIVSGVCIKRRIMQKDKQSNLTVYDQEIPVSIQSAAVSNSTHNLQNPKSESIRADRISSDRATFTVPNADRNMPSNYSLAKPIESNFDTANYIFAKPIETEGDYVYNSDYDHLNSPLKQNVDSDYSLSAQTMITNSDKVGTYDRLKSFERNTDLSSDSNSNYDHLPTNAGSDPTYDVSGKVIHEDSDKYDHLPLNFKHTTADDYQSTNDILAGDTTDHYDHFVLKQSEAI